ncbi:UPF0481 protein At3g47200 [Linum grandiflorum]
MAASSSTMALSSGKQRMQESDSEGDGGYAEIERMQEAVFEGDARFVMRREDTVVRESLQSLPLNQNQYQIIDMVSLQRTSDMLQNNVTRLTMFRVPQFMYQVNPLAYTPQFVSIGPFHHGNFNTLAMEDYKRVFMLCLLEQTSRPDITLQACQDAVHGMMGDILACYHSKIDISWDLLANVILVDSCFMLQILFLNNNIKPYFGDGHLDNPYKQMLNSGIRRDLALLENQLPFFVLEKLLSIFRVRLVIRLPDNTGLSELAFNVFKSNFNIKESLTVPPAEQNYKHLLDLVAKSAHPSSSQPLFRDSQVVHLRNATKLSEAGIKFEAAGESTLLELEFINGVFKIPPLVINECTESLLRNLVAFEFRSRDLTDSNEYFASYVFLMERLVSSKEDLELLESKGILINQLGGREDATNIFCNISKNFVVKKFYFGELCCTVEAHCRSRRHRYLQDLLRHYLKNPWTTSSVVAACILLVLTAIQTYYSYAGYVHRR